MKYTKTLTIDSAEKGPLQIGATVIFLGLSILLPFLVHLIPGVEGAPLGARLLPLFYAPLIAAVFFRVHVGIIAGVLAPLVNFVITGQPAFGQVMVLSMELGLFAWIAHRLNVYPPIRWVLGPLAFVFAKVFSTAVVAFLPTLKPGVLPTEHFLQPFVIGWSGLIMLGILSIVALRVQNRR